MKLILASGSPRRRELLAAAGLVFEVVLSPAEELHDGSMGPGGLCEENAWRKAMAVAVEHADAVVVGADTLVFLDGEPLGKPRDMDEARAMLRRLSGCEHEVCTGVAMIGGGMAKRFHEVTKVIFRDYGDEVIEAYLAVVPVLDKAGSYGIQDRGEWLVERIEGAFDNVMGLPVEAVLRALRESGLAGIAGVGSMEG